MITNKVRFRTSLWMIICFARVLCFFPHSALVSPFFHLDMKFFRCKNGKTIRLNIEQVSFQKDFFKHVCQKFHSISFPEHHFVISTMTARGFLNGWHRLTKKSDCWQRFYNKINILILQQLVSTSSYEQKLERSMKETRNRKYLKFQKLTWNCFQQ